MRALQLGVLGVFAWLATSAFSNSGEGLPPLLAQAGVTGDPTTPPEIERQSDELFVDLDKDHDGYLNETEAGDTDFDEADADGDGRIDTAEFAAARDTAAADADVVPEREAN